MKEIFVSNYVIALLVLSTLIAIVFTILSFKKTLANLYLKTASSMLFVFLGIASLYSLVIKRIEQNPLSYIPELRDNSLIGGFLILVGLIVCLIGDIILGMPRISELKRDRLPVIVGGAAWFALGHVIYCLALISLFGINPWVIAFIIPMALFYTYVNKFFGKLDYKKLTWGVFLYSLIESLSFALCVTEIVFNYSTSLIVLTLGFALFYASDMVLMHNYFGEKRRLISILCHSFYYPAQILIALSICFLA